MYQKYLPLALFLCFFVPSAVFAGPIVRTGETISIDAEQSLKGDFYGLGSDISISGVADNDAYLFGGNITVNAPITEDVTAVGGVVQIHGEVGDDVRVFGGEVTIAEPVGGDLVVVGGTLTILSTAKVAGDVLFYGEKLVVEGEVMGSVFGTADTIRIDDIVHGDVSANVGSLIAIGDSAQVSGDISYTSPQEIGRAPNARIDGEVHRMSEVGSEQSGALELLILTFFVLLFVSLTLYVLAQKRIESVLLNEAHTFGMYGLIGLTFFILAPVAALVLMASIIGTLLGILLFILYFAGLIISGILSGMLLGYTVLRVFKKQTQMNVVTVSLGILLVLALTYIPYVGGLIFFAFLMVSLGKVTSAAYSIMRSE